MKHFITKFKGPILLFITAFFWGLTFIAQEKSSYYIGPNTFNAGRYMITGIIMTIVYFITKGIKKKTNNVPNHKTSKKVYLISIVIGVVLFAAATLQQVGLDMTKSSTSSGFLTTTYIVFVPLIGILFKKKIRPIIWFFLILVLIGSYLISVDSSLNISLGDVLTIFGALGYALQIILIDLINPEIDTIKLSAIEFMVTGIICVIVMLVTEGFDAASFVVVLPYILYAAIFSGCIAFTFQIEGQKTTDPTIASLIMSLESVVCLFSEIIIEQSIPTPRIIIGCSLIFISIIFSQLDLKKIFKKRTYSK